MIYRSRSAPVSTVVWNYSKSYYKTLGSDFMHIFRTAQFDPLTAFRQKVAQFMAGMKLTVTKDMQERGVTCEYGKYPMVFSVFKRLFQLISASGSAEHFCERFWLTLEWSLISIA